MSQVDSRPEVNTKSGLKTPRAKSGFLMVDSHDHAVTVVLRAIADGDEQAAAELLPLVYEELRSLARSRMGQLAPGQTLQPTALVHEAYLRVVGDADPGWDGRGHFFAAAAQAMRQIIVEQARRKAAVKHGGGRARVDLAEATPVIEPPTDQVLALDETLKDLEKHSPRKAELVTLRYFGGLTMEEAAAALGVSVGTVERDWRYVKAWFHDRRSDDPHAESE